MLTEIRLEECELDCAMIGKRVRDARKAKKVTQEELSEHCGCTPTHICNLENGKIGVSLELLFRISLYLGKSMDYFVMDKLDAGHIQFVLDCLREKTSKVRNIRKYLLSVLYNASMTIDNYYSALVNHDLYCG